MCARARALRSLRSSQPLLSLASAFGPSSGFAIVEASRRPERAVGSHHTSVFPGEEEPFVMNDLSQGPFERVPGPDLAFDLCGIDAGFCVPHNHQKYR